MQSEGRRSLNQRLFETSQDLILVTDGYGTLIDVSPSALAILGYRPEEMIGRSGSEFIYPDDLEPTREQMRAARRGHATRYFPSRYRHKAGEIVSLEWMGVWSEPDHHHLFVGRDISERVRLKARLDEEMSRLRSIVESSGALVVLTDRDRRIIMVNREFERLYGIPADRAVGSLLPEIVTTNLEPGVYRRWIDQPPGDGEIASSAYTTDIVHPSGERRILTMTATPILDDDRQLLQIVFLGVDDTDLREAKDALHQSERLATIGEMAAGVAHEIAQPLQVIEFTRAGAQRIVEKQSREHKPVDTDFIIDILTRISRELRRADRIVADLRSFVRDSPSDALVRIDAAEAVRSALDLTRHGLTTAQVMVREVMPAALPPLSARPGTLEQVLVNLLNNARDAGGSLVEVEASMLDGQGRPTMRLTVSDNGPGIPADVMPKLFAQFVTTKAKGGGTGLGLRICRRLIEEMGGTITAGNRPEGGARFEMLIPCRSRELDG